MRPYNETRVGNLGPDDYLKLECRVCRHTLAISGETLRLIPKAPPRHQLVRNLQRRLKCKGCNTKGNVSIFVAWAS